MLAETVASRNFKGTLWLTGINAEVDLSGARSVLCWPSLVNHFYLQNLPLTAATSEAGSSTQTNQLYKAHRQYFALNLCYISLNFCPDKSSMYQCLCAFQRVGWLTVGAVLISRNWEPIRKMIPLLSQTDSFGMHFIRVSREFQRMKYQLFLIVTHLITPFLFHSRLPCSCPWEHFKINDLQVCLCLRLYH